MQRPGHSRCRCRGVRRWACAVGPQGVAQWISAGHALSGAGVRATELCLLLEGGALNFERCGLHYKPPPPQSGLGTQQTLWCSILEGCRVEYTHPSGLGTP